MPRRRTGVAVRTVESGIGEVGLTDPVLTVHAAIDVEPNSRPDADVGRRRTLLERGRPEPRHQRRDARRGAEVGRTFGRVELALAGELADRERPGAVRVAFCNATSGA